MKVLLTILATVGVLILLGVIVIFGFMYYVEKSLETKFDPALYCDIVQDRVSHSDQYTFLPTRIPKEALKVAFLHAPGALQGSDKLGTV